MTPSVDPRPPSPQTHFSPPPLDTRRGTKIPTRAACMRGGAGSEYTGHFTVTFALARHHSQNPDPATHRGRTTPSGHPCMRGARGMSRPMCSDNLTQETPPSGNAPPANSRPRRTWGQEPPLCIPMHAGSAGHVAAGALGQLHTRTPPSGCARSTSHVRAFMGVPLPSSRTHACGAIRGRYAR